MFSLLAPISKIVTYFPCFNVGKGETKAARSTPSISFNFSVVADKNPPVEPADTIVSAFTSKNLLIAIIMEEPRILITSNAPASIGTISRASTRVIFSYFLSSSNSSIFPTAIISASLCVCKNFIIPATVALLPLSLPIVSTTILIISFTF